MDKTDEHAGMGGSYLLDAKTGKRTLVHRTAPPETNRTPDAEAPPAPARAKPDPAIAK